MDQNDLERLITTHELWFKDRSRGARLDLENATLKGVRIVARRLIGARLKNVDLSAAILVDTEFDRSQLENVSFCDAEMARATLSGARLRHVDFTRAKLDQSNFDDVIADGAIFDGARMDRSSFVKATLERCSLRAVSLVRGNLTRVHISRSSFEAGVLREVDFSHALLVDVDLRKTDLSQAIFRNARLGPIHVFGIAGAPAVVENCGLEQVDLSELGDGSENSPDALAALRAVSR